MSCSSVDSVAPEAPSSRTCSANHHEAVSIGELVHLWTRGLRDNELCGCGEPLGECSFWKSVGEVAFGGWDELDLDEMMRLQHAVDRNRYVPLMISPVLPSYRRDLDNYTGVLSRIYRAISEVSGAPVVVDSTKHVSYAYLLRRVPGIDVRVAHLVRESQGVAHSWAKTVRRPEASDSHDEMPRYTPTRTSAKWLMYNAALHGLSLLKTPRHLVRYEDVITNPRTHITELLELADLTPGNLNHLGDSWVELGQTHTVAGNPSRFKQGRVDLALDRAWRHDMDNSDKRLVTALTWPLSKAYGYPVEDPS